VKILGIDPGYGIIGWSLISSSLKIIDYGTIETSPDLPIEKRLCKIYEDITAIIEDFHPDHMALERLFFKKNTTTAIDVAKAIGVMTMTAGRFGIELFEYTPTQIKFSITGYGQATKKQIQLLIKKIFNIKDIPEPDDAADALAIALCHCLSSSLKKSRGRTSG